jgi:CRP/FNR family transcriptional regulator
MEMENTKIWYLKNLDVFSHLPDEDHEKIEKVANMRPVAKGERLYLQGSADKNIYILKKGAVKIVKQTSHGKEVILDVVQSGTIFGEMSAIDPKERDESAEMIEDGLICTFDRERFQELMQNVPGLSIKITKMIHFRFRKIENRLLDLLHSSVEQRLSKTLINLMEEFGVPHKDGYLIKVKLTHNDYADLIASTRETVTATFNKLKKMGILDFENKYVVIKSEDKLKNICW